MNAGDIATLVALISQNPLALIIVIVLVLGTGGVGVAAVQAFAARKLNISGNALVKEKNSIDGFTALSTIQETTITRQENTIKAQGETIVAQGKTIEEQEKRITSLERKFDTVVEILYNEIALSDARENDRLSHNLPPMQRTYNVEIPTDAA